MERKVRRVGFLVFGPRYPVLLIRFQAGAADKIQPVHDPNPKLYELLPFSRSKQCLCQGFRETSDPVSDLSGSKSCVT